MVSTLSSGSPTRASPKRFAPPESRDTAGVIAYRFGREDLLRTRFAISPLFELQAAWRAARPRRALGASAVGARGARPARGPRLRAARRAAPERAVRARLRRAAAAHAAARRRGGARARARDPARRVRHELGWAFEGREPPAVARPLLDDPAAALPALVDLMAEYWARAIAPWWDAIRAVLEADIRHRARHLASGGALELFAGPAPGRQLAATARCSSTAPTRRRSSSPAAGCSSSRPRSAGRASARCSTRRGSRR